MRTRTISDNPLDRAVPLNLLGSVSDATLSSNDDGSTGSSGRYASSAIMSFGSRSPGRSPGGSSQGSSEGSSTGSSTATFDDPYMIIEFIENGLLSDFIGKAAQHIQGAEEDTEPTALYRSALPNRVLWGFFFCRKLLS